jgi:hypothetical protein
MSLCHTKGQLSFHFSEEPLPKTLCVFYPVSVKLLLRLISGFNIYVLLMDMLVIRIFLMDMLVIHIFLMDMLVIRIFFFLFMA